LVRDLESRLGVRLVERTTRSVAATEAGERLLTRLRPVLDDYQAALESISDFRDKPAGTLRLTVASPAAHFVLAPVIPRFLAAYPDITLEISVNNRLTDIVAERYDAGIRPGKLLERDMIAVRVSDNIGVIHVAAPSYLAARGVPKTPQDLIAHNCIRFRLPSGTMLPWRFRGNEERFEAHLNGTLVVDEIILGIRAAVDGVGVLQILPQYVAREIAEGRLITVLENWAPTPMDGFYLYYSSRRQIRPALKALIDFLREHRKTSGPSPANEFALSDEFVSPVPDGALTPVLS
jgi:DNA-binding transcriptional LysR family regulator